MSDRWCLLRDVSTQRATVVVGFGLDWDDEERRIISPLSRSLAQKMHEAARPYCMVLANENGSPILRARVHGAAGYLGYITHDLEGRPTIGMDYHRFGEVLALRRVHIEAPDTQMTFTVEIQPDGEAETDLRSKHGSFQQRPRVPAEHRILPEPSFGPSDAEEGWFDAEIAYQYGVPPEPDAGELETGPVGWAVPDLSPASPHRLNALFTPGTRLRADSGGKERTWTVKDAELAGTVKLPTGHVVASDPYLIDENTQPFTVTVPPGQYPLYLAHVSHGDHEWTTVSAAKLEVSPRPTATWELALLPGQDTALLGKDQFYGFGVDTGTGAFLDHSACPAFLDLDDVLEATDDDADLHPDGFGEFQDRTHGTGANMITYPSGYGDGSYPVWIGRDEDGEVTCFVANMYVVGVAEPESPAATPEPRLIEPPNPDRSSWAPTKAEAVMRPGTAARYFAEMFQRAAKGQASMLQGRQQWLKHLSQTDA